MFVGLMVSFRPLSRYIGLYQDGSVDAYVQSTFEFPFPLEVIRFISVLSGRLKKKVEVSFRPLSR